MTREWKPGEVATIVTAHGVEPGCTAIREERGGVWTCQHGRTVAENVLDARPLVVIDPEDPKQVGRLAALLQYAGYTPTADTLTAALRSLITPPRPDEPTGLGAVVEDEDGFTYVRGYSDDDSMTHHWHVIDPCANKPRAWWKWSEFTAVRILSEGVKP